MMLFCKYIMDLIIIESSKQACIAQIRQHIRYDIRTSITYKLQVKQICNHYHPILNEFIPNVLSSIVIEYTNDIFDVDIIVTQYFSRLYRFYICNDVLHIKHRYQISFENKLTKIDTLIIDKIFSIEYKIGASVYYDHSYFINYYMTINHPTKQQLIHNCPSHYYWNYRNRKDNIIDNIIDRKIFDNELTVVIALCNSLHNIVI